MAEPLDVVRLKVSTSGSFTQAEAGGSWRYVGGDSFLESVPATWRYAELTFHLSEKVNSAVSVKYQVPGEELDPDALISVADDSDVQELFDEYFRALRLPGTPVKTFRLRVFLFTASEDPLTPEDMAAAAVHERYLRASLAYSGGSREGGSLNLSKAFSRISATPGGSHAAATATPSNLSSGFSSGSGPGLGALAAQEGQGNGALAAALGLGGHGEGEEVDGGDGATTPSAADTELAWEAGFRAGQEAAARAAEEWQHFVGRRMAELVASRGAAALLGGPQGGEQQQQQQQQLTQLPSAGGGSTALPLAWSGAGLPSLHRPPSSGLPGGSSAMLDGLELGALEMEGEGEEEAEADEAALAAELAAAAAAGDALAGQAAAALITRALTAPLPHTLPPSVAPSGAPSAQGSPQRLPPLGGASAGGSGGAGGGTVPSPYPPLPVGGVRPLLSVSLGPEGGRRGAAAAEGGGDEPDLEFQSMFESKYERQPARPPLARPPAAFGPAALASGARGGAEGPGQGRRGASPPSGAATHAKAAVLAGGGGNGWGTQARPPSPDSLLPKHISVFGDGGGGLRGGRERAASGAGAGLPSHISAFGGGSEDEEEEEAAMRDGSSPDAMLSVLKAALPEGDVCAAPPARVPRPPGSIQLPTSFELLAGAADGLSPCLTPGPEGGAGAGALPAAQQAAQAVGLAADAGALPQQPADLQRSPSIEQLLSKVQRVEASQVTVLAKIGEGAFGEVSLAECPTYGRVAVKWIKPTKVERHWASFWHEAELMSRLNHPNVLRFYGLVVEGPLVVGIMTEFAGSGSLGAYLRSGVGFIPLRQRALLALHAVNGMAYLHAQQVVHFDVKPDNLLVDGDWLTSGASGPTVKVADFGLSKHKYNTFCSNVHDLRGTLPYMAPEMVMDHQRVTEKADVWSLGVVFWELLTLEVPFADLPPAQLIGALGLGRLRLPVPDWCEPEWRALMEACWVVDPALRPTCRQLAAQLERIRDLAPQ